MAQSKLPYVTASGNITKALERIKIAKTPDRFSQDFLATKLSMPGGSPRPVIPFLKRTGFLASDGTPTDLYRQFRNESESGAAAAEALRKGFAPLYEINEYAHELTNAKLKGAAVQVTGLEENSSTIKAIVGSFNALKAFADFDAAPAAATVEAETGETTRTEEVADLRLHDATGDADLRGLRLGYTINLNLPATSDVAVFDAIFKSLRDNLLR